MREIKFRAWDTRASKWYGSLNPPLVWLTARDYKPPNFTHSQVPNGVALMQYTGLKDRDGKEIYEGDVYRFIVDGTTGPITFENGAFRFRGNTIGSLRSDTHEVIGNIYENPELLTEK